MKTTVEALEDNKVKLSFEIDAKEVNTRIKQAYKNFAKRYNFPGFRPGKAPRPVVDNMMGADTVKASLTEDLVNELYPLALDEHNLVPLFKPEFDMDTEIVRGQQAVLLLHHHRCEAILRAFFLRQRVGRDSDA